MEMKPITGSSHVAATGHEGNVMHVKYHDGALCEFTPVTAKQHEEIRAARSVGAQLHRLGIKGRKL